MGKPPSEQAEKECERDRRVKKRRAEEAHARKRVRNGMMVVEEMVHIVIHLQMLVAVVLVSRPLPSCWRMEVECVEPMQNVVQGLMGIKEGSIILGL